MQSFVDFPNYYVSDTGFSNPVSFTDANPQQNEYAWGKSELIEYTDAKGRRLQAALSYPANHQPGRKYPMITNIYELRSNRLHRYVVPSQRGAYNHSVFTSQGYFVLQPDILFDAGDPGISSVRTMEIAVKKVVDMGLVDEERVGLVGHSWGGLSGGVCGHTNRYLRR